MSYLYYEFICDSWYHRGKPTVTTADYLELKMEPKNRCDKYAVAIYHMGRKVGYVPRSRSEETTEAIKSGKRIRVVCTSGSDMGTPVMRVYDSDNPNLVSSSSKIADSNPNATISCIIALSGFAMIAVMISQTLSSCFRNMQ